MSDKNSSQDPNRIIPDKSREVATNRQLPPTNTKTVMPKVKPVKNEKS